MSSSLQWFDLVKINNIYTGLTTIYQTMTPLIIPLFVQMFVGEERQGTYYGFIRLGTLMAALLTQSIIGNLSDRSTIQFGKRRPFIFIGSITALLFLAASGFAPSIDGEEGFWYLFIILILLMVSTNTAQAAAQGLIPDLVPIDKRGVYSGAKALFEVPIPLIVVALVISKSVSNGKYWDALFIIMGILAITMCITMFVREKKPEPKKSPLNWENIIRLLLMTIVFTLIILVLGWIIRQLGNIVTNFNTTTMLILFGGFGLLSMLIAIGAGVSLCVRIAVGADEKVTPSFTWWIINRLAFLAGVTNIASFALFFLQARLGYTGEKAAQPVSVLLMIVGAFILLLALPSGWLSDRIGPKRIIAYSGIIAVVGTLSVIISESLPVIYIGGSMIGIATGMFYTSNWSLGTQLVPLEHSAKYLGISNLAGAGAGAVGAFIGGPIADYFTIHTPQIPGLGYILIYAIFGMLFVFSIFAISQVKYSIKMKQLGI